jgi:hypothetical protein
MAARDYMEWEKLETVSKATSAAEKGLNAGRCSTCANATIYRRKGQMNVEVYCSSLERVVPSDIEECSAYSDPKAMSLYEMQQIALQVDGRIGVSDKAYA